MMTKKILVVDDDPTVIKIVSTSLQKSGYEVLAATNGKEGLAKAQDAIPDLIILDVMMPELNGYDVCRLLKFDRKFKSIPIVLLTVRNQELDSAIGKEVGIDYLPKPLDIKVLLKRIKKHLGEE